MKITKKHLSDAVAKEIISEDQSKRLFDFLNDQPSVGPSFDFTHVLYYMGGIIAIGAMSLFMTLGWESFGGWGIFSISLLYAVAGLTLTNKFKNNGYAIPAGICATFVVALAPLAIYGLQQAMGWWPVDDVYKDYHRLIEWHWIYMELGTLVVGALVVWKFKYPFIIMPMAFTFWYMSMDLTPLLAADLQYGEYFDMQAIVSTYFGLFIILIAFGVDIKTKKEADYSFWLYIFGVMAFWGGLSIQNSDSELNKFLYFCINIIMMGVGVLVVRRVFVVFGAFGSMGYLGYLSYDVFKASWLFPISLTFLGLLVIYLGILWQKNEKGITEKVQAILPDKMREFLNRES